MRVCSVVLGLAAIVLCSNPAHAQIAVYAQATGASLQALETAHMYGGTFGIYDTRRRGPLDIGGDVRVAFTNSGGKYGALSDQTLDFGQVGVRVAAAPGVLPLVPALMPYAEALVGLGYWRGGYSVTRQDANHSLVQAVVGADLKIIPRIYWRVAEFTYGRAGAMPGHIDPITISTGFVIRLQ